MEVVAPCPEPWLKPFCCTQNVASAAKESNAQRVVLVSSRLVTDKNRCVKCVRSVRGVQGRTYL